METISNEKPAIFLNPDSVRTVGAEALAGADSSIVDTPAVQGSQMFHPDHEEGFLLGHGNFRGDLTDVIV